VSDEWFWFWALMVLYTPVWIAAAYTIIDTVFGYWLHPDDWGRVDPRKWLQVQVWYWRRKGWRLISGQGRRTG